MFCRSWKVATRSQTWGHPPEGRGQPPHHSPGDWRGPLQVLGAGLRPVWHDAARADPPPDLDTGSAEPRGRPSSWMPGLA
eukprot:10097183-Alexandrium_andersonii.AAC.1